MKPITLLAPYFAQCDNEDWAESDGYGVPGNVQCAATSNAMLLAYKRPEFVAKSVENGFVEPESYYKSRFNSLGYSASDRGNHDCHTETLKSFGLCTEWRTDLSHIDICNALNADRPVVVGMNYKAAGHITMIVGFDADGYLIHDPYGLRCGACDEYSYINPGFGETHGAFDHFGWGNLAVTLWDIPSEKKGAWGRLVLD